MASVAALRALRHPATLLILLPIVVLGPALLPGRVLSPADALFSFYPWRALDPGLVPQNPSLGDVVHFLPWLLYASREITNGRLPLWNPRAFAGAPFLANAQSAVLFPYTALAYLVPLPAALGLAAILKLLLTSEMSAWF
jgi:hypothetical protein